jgi:hypothetical protein
MAETLKVLAQLSPSATTLTTLYAVPSSTSTVISSLIICNTTGSTVTFRVSLAPAAAADNIKQYLYYDLPLLANDTFIATIGISLATTDLIRVYASATNVSFTATGVEVT